MSPGRRALRLGLLGLLGLLAASLVTVLALRDRPTTHPHSQTATRHAYPQAFVTHWTAWCAKRVGETWCQCAMRRAQEIYDFKKFNTPQTDWSPFFRACGDQGPGPQPPIAPG
jgi:hypothetical protein